ncbi:aspartate/glutamate racemase family protein [Shewanella fidelis]|uniref:Aspartate/glutamate racemase family protein n=1 Tax=Shewanella fidelis TaxID=173509 RepID=A0AAW8NSW1_9GAMM|nr:aspartate/glutamate racemase family protein [Shewanella fidelis]MDR8525281.1 aspartate/glutamate racemase family protein [Shewanella fidelis]MDW4813682.1 aspartate/glutamate racemase family protein [Shewanella fidelis]MDW4817660.1 aspartate/glutamate racemase family protein [Shewanella fidelis]MDW4821727.1 aspartate/glutamate racemase family protein [Shewanella fidelis]MDW4826010.1 aspartate/glutamate racemase family protein [Shewanella fidelis]
MKTIGMLGGMSWESTASYYNALNQGVKAELGGLHSAKVALYSVDFAEIEELQHKGEWQQTAAILSSAAKSVEAAGADFLLICTNTMHKVADDIQANINIPILHIADATASQLVTDGIKKVGLLGTAFTMEQDFYKSRLQDKYAINVIVPEEPDRRIVHSIIYEELCRGVISARSRTQYLAIIASLEAQGAEAVILGCTEIALLVQQQDTHVPLYDTTEIHAAKAVELALMDR